MAQTDHPRAPEPLERLAANQPRQSRRRKAVGVAFSVGAHLSILAAMLFLHRNAEPEPLGDDGPAMMASLVDGIKDEPAPAAATQKPQKRQTVVKASKQTSFIRKAKLARQDDDDLKADEEPAPVLTAAQVAIATTAESGGGEGGGGEGLAGGGGKPCNMAQRLQQALRRDARVQTAIAASTGPRDMFVWNGDWVRSGGQDGKGLAALREAILWEVGFAPEACRKAPIHGLVSISLHDGAGSPKVVLGQGSWRWQDILGVKE